MSRAQNRVAVFLDRDNTIIADSGYTYRARELRFLPGAKAAIRRLNRAGFLVVVVTNQSGIGRGYYTVQDVARFHQAMNRALARSGARIDAFYCCPHHPTEAQGRYRVRCRCRKPAPGMIRQAIRELGICARKSFMIGDKESDIRAGLRAGLKTYLLSQESGTTHAHHRMPDLAGAVRHILARAGRD